MAQSRGYRDRIVGGRNGDVVKRSLAVAWGGSYGGRHNDCNPG